MISNGTLWVSDIEAFDSSLRYNSDSYDIVENLGSRRQ